MRRLASAFPERRCLVVTLPGYEGTPPSPSRQGYAAIHEALVDALTSRNVVELDIVGYSVGGYRAMTLALSGRFRVTSLTLLAPVLALSEQERAGFRGFANALRARVDIRGAVASRFASKRAQASHPSVVAEVVGWLDLAPADVLADELDDMATAPSILERALDLSAPAVTLRVGADDVVTPLECCQRFVELVPHTLFEQVPEQSHALLVEDFQGTVESVRRTLSRGNGA
jgi:pimeloyl-ACP methyl ester carboxylesterase